MANLIDKTYFIRDISLPAQVLDGTFEAITNYIVRYEKKALMMLLGYELYTTVKAEINAASYSDPWDGLVNGKEYTNSRGYTIKWEGLKNDGKESMLAYYIYYNYVRDQITHSSGIGEVLSQGENSTRVSPLYKLSAAYNRFCELFGSASDSAFTPSAYNYLYAHRDEFENWVLTPVEKGNAFGI